METKKFLKLLGQAQQSHQVCNDVNDNGNADDHGGTKTTDHDQHDHYDHCDIPMITMLLTRKVNLIMSLGILAGLVIHISFIWLIDTVRAPTSSSKSYGLPIRLAHPLVLYSRDCCLGRPTPSSSSLLSSSPSQPGQIYLS